MSTFTCPGCNARFRLPPGAEGRKVRCTKCGHVSQVPAREEHAGPISLAGEPDDFLAEAAAAAARSREPAPGSQSVVHDPAASDPRVLEEAEEMVRAGRVSDRRAPGRGFWADVGWNFLFVTTPGNAITFLILWAMLGAREIVIFAPCVGLLAYIILTGYVWSFLLNCVSEAASGEDDLPALRFTEGVWEDIILPILKFSGVSLLLAVPPMTYLFFALRLQSQGLANALPTIFSPISSVGGSGVAVVVPFFLLCAASLLLWPIAILVVAIGGMTDLFRLDLIVRTVIRTFVPYLTIFLLVAAAFGMKVGIALLMDRASGAGSIQVDSLVVGILALGVQIYFDIVTMRIIGLYYRHFKDRFAWSWE
jgi:predicted Zn finger-like uncharacterized protein